ncbi:hypothetical protein [Patulibacter sp. SYSU D01012]|uniref:hypothetical protein n=1 Tax=Patulibacter sp. SYSU D01012 TaxID=2817381 RepID=UPI001B3139E1|nr:hypothetical protein [Patulibacter sp. SYSU D01012]
MARGTSSALVVGAALIWAVPAHAAAPPVVAPPGGYADGRAAEVVSPVEKNGGQVTQMWPAAGDGDAVIFAKSAANPADGLGSPTTVATLATRTADGWKPRDLTLTSTTRPGASTHLVGASSGLDNLVFEARPNFLPEDEDLVSDTDLYAVRAADRAASLITREDGVAVGTVTGATLYAGGSADLSTMMFLRSDSAPLLPTVPVGGTTSLYRWREGSLEVISRLPDDTFANVRQVSNAERGFDDRGPTAFTLNNSPVGNRGAHRVSDDGRRVYFETDFAGLSSGLYLRDRERTIPVSVSRRAGDPAEVVPAYFVGATSDGATAYFISASALTPGAAGGGLYRYSASTDEVTRLTRDPGPGGPRITSAQASDDGTTVYLVAEAALAQGATDGERNAYVWHDGSLDLVGPVGPNGRVERVSRDGAHAVFVGQAPGAVGTVNALYRYDRTAEELACASCRSDGSANQTDAYLDGPDTQTKPGLDTLMSSPRGLTDDGRLFFMTTDRLLPEDEGSGTDVYEYGTNGRLRLLTPGRGEASYLLDNTDDGSSIFVSTPYRLTPQDTDAGEYDAYSLRIGGGFPESTAPATPCEGDDCQGIPQGRPVVASAGSTAVGAGNVRPPEERAQAGVRRAPTVSKGALAALARRGRGNVTVTVRGAGVVHLRATARIAGSTVVVGRSRKTVRPTTKSVTMTVRLSRKARTYLRRHGRLRLRLSAEMSTGGTARTRTITIKRTAR